MKGFRCKPVYLITTYLRMYLLSLEPTFAYCFYGGLFGQIWSND